MNVKNDYETHAINVPDPLSKEVRDMIRRWKLERSMSRKAKAKQEKIAARRAWALEKQAKWNDEVKRLGNELDRDTKTGEIFEKKTND